MADVIVLGSGPAGISASLYVKRAGLNAVVIGRGGGSLEKADKIENYYGFPEPVDAGELIKNGIAQAKRLGIPVIKDEVVSLSYLDRYVVETKSAQFEADSVILATGSSRKSPPIPGLGDFEGKGISYCAVCDAFFYRNRPVAVLGDSEYAFHEAAELMPTASSVVLLTNGREPAVALPKGLPVIKKEIAAFEGKEVLQSVRFRDGSAYAVSGVFIALGVAGSADLARKLGARTEGVAVLVDENMQTNVPGLFAAGDCTGGLLQISKAVYEGAKAGTSAVKFIRSKKR
ncbi:MAG: NAD(P)/FAD-dependent oxidoreductase [Bacillota bacterium]|nr:NAD(P)/FAD-dependent oxidoreductase [Bacillota bacterium]